MLAAFTALSVAACGKTVSVAMDDQAITTRVKTALLNDPGLSARNIEVQTAERVVTLAGTVTSAAEQDRAIQVARNTAGVADVRSELRIAP
jgi:osmotically-inducible protein OsmY